MHEREKTGERAFDLSLLRFNSINPLRIFNRGGPMKKEETSPSAQTEIFSQSKKTDVIPNNPISIEKWEKAKVRIDYYEGGTYPDGTTYEEGERLIIKGEQVMDTFETPWCEETVNEMFKNIPEGKPLTVVERGYGLGIMSKNILKKMINRPGGGRYHIIELNEEVYKKAEEWAKSKQEAIDNIGLPFEIYVHHGDADQILEEKIGDESVDLLFSDTHQLAKRKRGINDLLRLEELKRKLKKDGKFTFCAFHKNNQSGHLDQRQYRLLNQHFESYHRVRVIEVVPPRDCEYMDGPKALLPIIICQKPRFNAS